jgi:hypothetical protein
VTAPFVVTVNVRFALTEGADAERLARRIADLLMEDRSVVTVRVERDGLPSVYRIDVDAETADAAVDVAGRLTTAIAWGDGVRCEVLSTDVVRDDERPSSRSGDEPEGVAPSFD